MGTLKTGTRDFVLAANWKMHKTPLESAEFFKAFQPQVPSGAKRLVFFVPALNLSTAVTATKGSPVEVGCQNIYHEAKGAFTGENSPVVVAAMGAQWALVGHSERRALFGETDQDTAKKVNAALSAKLKVMLCIGETLQERETAKTMEVVKRQLVAVVSQVAEKSQLGGGLFTLAYEPVWAIGTGKVATPEQASEVHQFLRKTLTEILGADLAQQIPILYGGSVKPENAKQIASQPDIDGFLVGGASLEVASMLALVAV